MISSLFVLVTLFACFSLSRNLEEPERVLQLADVNRSELEAVLWNSTDEKSAFSVENVFSPVFIKRVMCAFSLFESLTFII